MIGYEADFHERMAELILNVGGQKQAARIAGVNSDTINNWRKPGVKVPFLGVLALARAANRSMEWVASGHEVRGAKPGGELDEDGETMPGRSAINFMALQPVRPDLGRPATSALVERWEPSGVAFSPDWLEQELGLSAEAARYAIAGDNGMAPQIGKGAFVIVDARPASLKSGLYMVAIGEELLARRVNRLPDGSSEIVADALPGWRFSLPNGSNSGLLLHRIVWAGESVE